MGKKTKKIKNNISLKIGGKPFEVEFETTKKPTSVRRMLPVFQRITNAFVKFGVDRANELGKEISCKAGCGACCRQPVPIGKAEAFALADLVEKMPEEKKKETISRFEAANEKLNEISWFERLAELESGDNEERRKLSMEYFSQNIACPFLVEESCSIHPNRPLSCREYLVTSPAENCADPKPEEVDVVEMPATPSRLLRKISRDSVKQEKDYLPLVSALTFAETNEEKSRKFIGQDWVRQFFEAMIEEQKSNKKRAK